MDANDLNVAVDVFVIAGMVLMYLFSRGRRSAVASRTAQGSLFLPGNWQSPYLSGDAPQEDTLIASPFVTTEIIPDTPSKANLPAMR